MSRVFSLNQVLDNKFLPTENTVIKNSLLALMGAFLLAAASQLAIPLTPVPFTLQNAMVVLIGLSYGPRLGFATIATYLTAGAAGLPVFSEFSAGPHVLMGLTGGYLLGFIPAVLISGFLAQQGFAKRYTTIFIAALAGFAVISGLGFMQLALFLGSHNAWVSGVKPFILNDVLKAVVVALLAKQCWRV